jgi:hypothetical protein
MVAYAPLKEQQPRDGVGRRRPRLQRRNVALCSLSSQTFGVCEVHANATIRPPADFAMASPAPG